MTTLAEQLASLPAALMAELTAHGFDPKLLAQQAASMQQDADTRNRLAGDVTAPQPGDVVDLPAAGSPEASHYESVGMQALREGQLAFIVLAGGMATRMGGVVKALVPAVGDRSFLDLRLGEQTTWARRLGHPVPLWLMTSYATDQKLRQVLGTKLDGRYLATFMQNISLRLTAQGTLFKDENGQPSLYAPGHGDLPEALERSGLLKQFLDRGGRYVWIANIDNLGATIDPVLLGWHIEHGAPLSVEVVDKVGSDRGGVPIRWRNRPMVLEEFRLPKDFDPATIRVFNTNTFLVTAKALHELRMPFTWVQVQKSVGQAKAVQFERLIGEISTALDTRFIRVPRQAPNSRFLPVKDNDELERRRDELAAVAAARGMLP